MTSCAFIASAGAPRRRLGQETRRRALTSSFRSLPPIRRNARPRARLAPHTFRSLRAEYGYNVYQDPQDREKRQLSSDDVYAVVRKPLGLTLEESDDGMVVIAGVDPGGNAARTGVLRVGQVVTAISATFGDEIWSVRGVGIDRVMKGLQVRSGDFITIVVEDHEMAERKKAASRELAARRAEEARSQYGEREVIDAVSWTKVRSPDASAAKRAANSSKYSESQLADELEREMASSSSPYGQAWLWWTVGGVAGILVILAVTLFA